MSARGSNDAYHFKATIGGQTFTQAQPNGLEHLQIEDHVDMIGVAKITLNLDSEGWSGVDVGAEVEVEVGQGSRKMFSGIITGMRHSYKRGREVLTIMAMDPLCKLAASRRTETYEEQTDSDIVSAVIGRAGLEMGQVDATSEVRPYVIQRNESDLEFCKRLAARNQCILMSNEGKVDFLKPQYGGSPVEIGADVLESLDWNCNAMSVPPTITTYGWDYVATSKVEGTAQDGDIEAIGGGRKATEVAGAIWGDQSWLADVNMGSQGSAKDVAVSELNRMARNFLRGTATVDGNSGLHAGARVRFTGHRNGFNPDVYVISARHVFEFRRGYSTEIQFCSNTMPT